MIYRSDWVVISILSDGIDSKWDTLVFDVVIRAGAIVNDSCGTCIMVGMNVVYKSKRAAGWDTLLGNIGWVSLPFCSSSWLILIDWKEWCYKSNEDDIDVVLLRDKLELIGVKSTISESVEHKISGDSDDIDWWVDEYNRCTVEEVFTWSRSYRIAISCFN